MPTEYQTITGRINSAVTLTSRTGDPKRMMVIQATVDVTNPGDRALAERCVVEGRTVDIVVSEEVK